MIKKAFKTLTYLLLMTPLFVLANDAVENVQVPSLKVKERLQSIEQINVTAAKEQVAVEPESAAVAALLREADAFDKEGDKEEAEAQLATH